MNAEHKPHSIARLQAAWEAADKANTVEQFDGAMVDVAETFMECWPGFVEQHALLENKYQIVCEELPDLNECLDQAIDREKSLEEQLETTRAVLAEARRLAIRVADKNIGPLSDHAREVQGAANDVLNDLPTFEEVAGLLANSSPASVRHDSASTTEGGD